MRILNIQPNSNYNVNYKANKRWVTDAQGKQLYKTTTYYFREDIHWPSIVNSISNIFKEAKHVNFINHACSNGMEPLSFLMAFLVYNPDFVNKITPIIAKDIDYDNIAAAKNGQCGVSLDDFMRVCKLTKNRRNEFLYMKQAENPENLFVLSPKKILTDKVTFEQGDIFNDIENMPRENTFLSCRNFWIYLPEHKREELAYKMGKQFDKTSTILIGYLDEYEANVGTLLKKNGFHKSPYGNDLINIMYSK